MQPDPPLSASTLAEMGVCERRVLLEQRYGRRASSQQASARRRGVASHRQFFDAALKGAHSARLSRPLSVRAPRWAGVRGSIVLGQSGVVSLVAGAPGRPDDGTHAVASCSACGRMAAASGEAAMTTSRNKHDDLGSLGR